MKALAGLGLAALPPAAAAGAHPDGRPFHALRPRLSLREPRASPTRSRRPRGRRSWRCSPRCSCWCSSRRAPRYGDGAGALRPGARGSRSRTSSRTPGWCTRTWGRRWRSWRPSSPGTAPGAARPPGRVAARGQSSSASPSRRSSRASTSCRSCSCRRSSAAAPRTARAGPRAAPLACVGRRARRCAGVVVLGVYAAVTSRMDRERPAPDHPRDGGGRGAPRLSRRDRGPRGACRRRWRTTSAGSRRVARQNAVGGGVNFLLGQVSVEGFPSYFFVAFLAKSSLAFLLLTALLARRASSSAEGPRARTRRSSCCPPAVLFLASIGTSYNIGIRHLLPVYPLLAMAGAGLFRARARRGRAPAARPALLALCALPVVSAGELMRIHPARALVLQPLRGRAREGRARSSRTRTWTGASISRAWPTS